MTMQWIAEPTTAEETEVELLALEEELKAKRVDYRLLQAEIIEMESDRSRLKMLLADQLSHEYDNEKAGACAG